MVLHLNHKYNLESEANHFWEMTIRSQLQALSQSPVRRKRMIVLLPITMSRRKSTGNEMTIQLRRLLDGKTDHRSTVMPPVLLQLLQI